MNRQAGVTANGPARAANMVAPTYDFTVTEETPERVVLDIKYPSRARVALGMFPLAVFGILGGGLLLSSLHPLNLAIIALGAGFGVIMWLIGRFMKRLNAARVVLVGLAAGGLLLTAFQRGNFTLAVWGMGFCIAAWLTWNHIKRPKTVQVAMDARTIAINGKSYDLAHVRMIGLTQTAVFGSGYAVAVNEIAGNHITLTYGSQTVLVASVRDAANATMIRDKIISVLKGFGWEFGEAVRL